MRHDVTYDTKNRENVISREIWEPDDHWCQIHEECYFSVDEADYHGWLQRTEQRISSLTYAFQLGLLNFEMAFDAHLRSKLVKVSTNL